MRRRAEHETVRPLRERDAKTRLHPLRDRLAALAPRLIPFAQALEPSLPPGIVDRDADVWEPLFVVAELAGGPWPERAWQAALHFQAEGRTELPSHGNQLLADIRAVFAMTTADRLPTHQLLAQLHRLDGG